MDELDEFLDSLPSTDVLAGDTALGRPTSGKPHGKASDLLITLNPGEFHALGSCPFCPSSPSPKGKDALVLVDDKRTRLTLMCWAPDEHGHPPDTIRSSADGRTYSVWSWGPNRTAATRDTVPSDDQSVLADHVLGILASRYGLVAVRDEVIHVYDADRGTRSGGKENSGCSPTWGTWVPLDPTAVLEFVRRTLAGLSVRTVDKEGKEGARPVRVTVRLVGDVATLMLRTLRTREALYVKRMRDRRAITFDEQEAASSRFDFCTATLLNPGTVLNGKAEQELARPDHHVTSDCRVGFAPHVQHLPEWEAYVAKMIPDPADRMAFQMWVGAAVVGGCATKLQRHVVLLGPPGTGKSQLIELVASIFPASQRSAVSLAKLADRFSAFGLVGKRFNTSPEADTTDGRLPDVGSLKMILDGSTVQVERKNQQPVWARLTCAHLIAANKLPAGDAGEALYDRFKVIRATDVKMRRGPDAVVQWWKTKDYLRPAILAWAVEGLAKLDAAGWRLPESASSQEAMDEWREEGDTVFAWARSLPPAPPADDKSTWASPKATHDHYVSWCKASGRGALSSNKFWREAKLHVEYDRAGGRAYRVSVLATDPVVDELAAMLRSPPSPALAGAVAFLRALADAAPPEDRLLVREAAAALDAGNPARATMLVRRAGLTVSDVPAEDLLVSHLGEVH